MRQVIPDGFEPHFKSSSMTDPWEPLFSKTLADRIQIGFNSSPAHTNSRGFVHGGLISSIADNAMGLSCAVQYSGPKNLLTVHLAVDFISIAKVDQWLLFDTSYSKVGRSVCYAQCFVYADEKIVARANAVFKA
ncbi:MAG: PaaI family thioesterase [Oceanicoccus sp.]